MIPDTCIKNKKIGVVLVNWNSAEHTIPCIETLLDGIAKPDRIVVVDNASVDGSAKAIASRFPDIDLICNKVNAGFTGGNNLGINRLISLKYDYIWLLNNDTMVDKKSLLVLLSFMESHPEASACSGKIFYSESANRLWYAGATWNKWSLRFLHRGEGYDDVGQFDEIEKVIFLSGCCMFIRRESFERVGLFDDHFFAYNEDGDWCLRAERKHLQLYYVPQARIWHKISATMNKLKNRKTPGSTSPFIVYLTSRNRLYLIRKHAKGSLQTFTASFAAATWFCYYAFSLFLLRRMNKLEALVRGIYHGMNNSLDASDNINSSPYLPMIGQQFEHNRLDKP